MSSNHDLDRTALPDPRLPPELEEEIFLYAIQNEINDAANLFLVCKRVRQWLLPIVFKVVIVYPGHSVSFAFHNPSHYHHYGKYIQHLLLCDDNTDVTPEALSQLIPVLHECFLHCPNITDLALWCDHVELRSLTALTKLTRLSLDVHHLRRLLRDFAPNSKPSSTGGGSPGPEVLFPNITHLNILLRVFMDTPDCEAFILTLAYHFPSLTHFAHSQFLWEESNHGMLGFTLRTLTKLRMLVLWKSGTNEAVEIDEETQFPIDDQRVVVLITVWEMCFEEEARGTGLGMWGFAEQVLEERAKGGIR